MKKYVTASLFIFWAITVAIIVAGLLVHDKNTKAVNSSNTGGVNQVGNITGVRAGVTTLTLSQSELIEHNSYSSCWLLISGKIYDVTTYLNSHPGGEAEILKTCGTDATVIYDNRDNTGRHSSNARAMLADYYIGDLNQTVKTSPGSSTGSGQVNLATPPIANPSAATQTRNRDYDDD
ncbi:MAG: cytochrome b5 domain-containing protein [Candidatus Paceibacterota bacterium]|jgi:cytochrome b involved in lipid metabolism